MKFGSLLYLHTPLPYPNNLELPGPFRRLQMLGGPSMRSDDGPGWA